MAEIRRLFCRRRIGSNSAREGSIGGMSVIHGRIKFEEAATLGGKVSDAQSSLPAQRSEIAAQQGMSVG